MYLDYYGLREPPFDITPNPRFLFYSAKHREAYNHLLYGIRERKGFVQLTGEVGAGKTTLCRALLEGLDELYATALILNPVMSAEELVKAIAIEFGLPVHGLDRPRNRERCPIHGVRVPDQRDPPFCLGVEGPYDWRPVVTILTKIASSTPSDRKLFLGDTY